MPKLYPEPLLFCLAWAALALTAGIMASIWMGILFSAGLALVLMPLTATIVSKTGDFTLERQVRWGLLVVAGLGLAIWLHFTGALPH
jgi:uncharacterized protein (DUF58 family)